jgi:hypothetical protein
MAVNTADARNMISAHQEKYQQIIKETLRWKPIERLPYFDQDPRSGQLRLELAQNELLILESPTDTR